MLLSHAGLLSWRRPEARVAERMAGGGSGRRSGLPLFGPPWLNASASRGVAPAESSYILRGPSRKGPESAVDEGQRSHRSLFLKAF
jgi:hypothetical protein